MKLYLFARINEICKAFQFEKRRLWHVTSCTYINIRIIPAKCYKEILFIYNLMLTVFI